MTSKFSRISFKLKAPVQCRPSPHKHLLCFVELPLPHLQVFVFWRDDIAVEPFRMARVFNVNLNPQTMVYAGYSSPVPPRFYAEVRHTASPVHFTFFVAVYGTVGLIHDHTWPDVDCLAGLWYESPFLTAFDPHPAAPLEMKAFH